MPPATPTTWETARTPDEVIAALRSASEGARNSFGATGVTARCIGGRFVLSRRRADLHVSLGSPRFVGRVEQQGSGSRIVGRFWYGPLPALLRLLARSRRDAIGGADEESIRRHVEVTCEARFVVPSPRGAS